MPIILSERISPKQAANFDDSRGWTVRSGRHAKQSANGLTIIPEKKDKTPSLVAPRIAFKTSITVSLHLSNQTAGTIGISWRELDQKDFPRDQRVLLDVAAAPNGQNTEFTLPIKSATNHFRLHLPRRGATLQELIFQSEEGTQNWDFKPSVPAK